MYIIDKTNRDNRAADKKIINNGLKSSDPTERRQAEYAKYKIDHETTKIKSMREQLVRAHQNNDQKAVKEIHEFIKDRKDYQ